MLRTYWLTFRIHDDADYERRYDAIQHLIATIKIGAAWDEPTSFVIFQSHLSPDELAGRIRGTIDHLVDVVLLAHVGYKQIIVIGHTDDLGSLKRLVPYLK